jgi:hypothetical protein
MQKIYSTLASLLMSASLNLFAQDTLPFYIDPKKKLPEFELEDKKEGTFITGVPRFEFDPIRGFGAGGNAFIFFNKGKNDPFFEYTAYRHRINAEFFIFENGRIRYAINYDAPYLFNSKWRLRLDLVHSEDPNAQYWGIGSDAVRTLRFRDKRTGAIRDFRKVREYEENLKIAEQGADGLYYNDLNFNNMIQRDQLYNILAERVMLGGKLRLMIGYELLFTSFESYFGKPAEEAVNINGEEVLAFNNMTKVDMQRNDGTFERFNLEGFNNDGSYNFTSMLAWALIYDTRDFEPDPSNGIFLQYSHEYSPEWLFSDFNFNKLMLQGQYIHTLKRWNNNKSRLTFAGLTAIGHIFGSRINFIEMFDLSSQAEAGGILVLGGARSIRGFREARFLAPTAGLVNLELRSRLVDFKFLKQHFNLGLTTFYDFGSVWDSPREINFRNWVGAPGLGGRIAWNQSTILRLDYGKSKEGGQFFFSFGHIF